VLEAATSPTDPNAVPTEGDLTICLYCTAIAQFDSDLKLKEVTKEEFAQVPQEVKEQLSRIREAIRERIVNALRS
jgi:hypothetical protein